MHHDKKERVSCHKLTTDICTGLPLRCMLEVETPVCRYKAETS